MAYTVILKPGLMDVVLPNGNRYQGGQTVILSDSEFNVMAQATITALFSSATENSGSGGGTPGQDTPTIHGAAAWCYDPALAVNSTQLTAGKLYLVRVEITANVSITKIYWWVASAGFGATANQNWVGLYSSTGTRLASVNVDSAFSSPSLKTTTVPTTDLTAKSFCWVALLFNGSGPPTLTRASGWTGVDTAANFNLTTETSRFATNGTGRTTLPSSITLASNVGTDIAGPWVAVGE